MYLRKEEKEKTRMGNGLKRATSNDLEEEIERIDRMP
jgi:hypothetical protein